MIQSWMTRSGQSPGERESSGWFSFEKRVNKAQKKKGFYRIKRRTKGLRSLFPKVKKQN